MVYSDQYKFIFFAVPKTGSRSLQDYLEKFGIRSQKGWNPNHDSYELIKEKLGDKCMDYFKFAFFRNPWSMLISTFYYNSNKHQLPLTKKSIIEWLNLYNSPDPYIPYLFNKENNFILNFIGKIENINEDFKITCEKIGIPVPNTLPHIGKQDVKGRLHYTAYYTPKLAEKIKSIFARSLNILNYEFGDVAR